MSHTVTITRTTTTNGNYVFLNTGYLCSTPGLLKLTQLILGAVNVGLVAYYADHNQSNMYYYNNIQKPVLFFLIAAVACLVGTFCLLTACLCSLSSSSILSKTLYEVIYHSVACILYLAAGLTLLVEVNQKKNRYYNYDAYLAASVMGLILAALYLFSAVLANRSYRGI